MIETNAPSCAITIKIDTAPSVIMNARWESDQQQFLVGSKRTYCWWRRGTYRNCDPNHVRQCPPDDQGQKPINRLPERLTRCRTPGQKAVRDLHNALGNRENENAAKKQPSHSVNVFDRTRMLAEAMLDCFHINRKECDV
jgi:hypothetical protein